MIALTPLERAFDVTRMAKQRSGGDQTEGNMTLPMKTTAEDFNVLAAYLRNRVAWTPIATVAAAVPAKNTDGRKLEAMRFMGLLERKDQNIKLSDLGREYADAAAGPARAAVVQTALRAIPIYVATLEWAYYSNKPTPLKTDIANYWHDKHAAESGTGAGDSLTDAVVFFMRVADLAGLASFVPAGKNRDSHLKVDRAAVEVFLAGGNRGDGASPARAVAATPAAPEAAAAAPNQAPVGPTPRRITLSSGVHINIEIHIAADANATLIEDVFKNMKRYVLDDAAVVEE
jgi:hypothetical protein